MRPIFLLLSGLMYYSVSVAQSAITLEDIYLHRMYSPKSIAELRSMQDGMHYTINDGGKSVVQYAYSNGEKTAQIFHVENTNGVIEKFDGYAFNPEETALLLSTQREERYRRSAFFTNYVYDLKKKTTTLLSETGKQMYAEFAPAGNKVAYVIDNNLYYKDLDKNKEVRVTDDGRKNFIINGGSDWVYEEEFRLVRAFEWSPDGKKIA
ncbi:MAG: DPP IV N-terminal domain-containing protein, partial [Chitinophagales bacterium]